MKILTWIGMIVLFGISALAQQEAKIVAEIAGSSDKVVKNSPFSADAVSESVQTLADGNRIVHNSTSKLYRNSEGRFRREMANGSGGLSGTFYSFSPFTTILDPVVGQKYLLDTLQKTARRQAIKPIGELKITGNVVSADALKEKAVSAEQLKEQAIVLEKLKTELKVMTPTAVLAPSFGQTITGAVGSGGAFAYTLGSSSKYETKTEQLGMQNFEGVEAEGTRTTTTIPAGAIGNERPIEIVYERWYSKDLQLVVMSKHNDPRSGEQTYRLTNMLRTEPDPSLFVLPTGYKVISDPASVYRVTTAPKVELERAAAAKTPTTPTPAAKPKQQ